MNTATRIKRIFTHDWEAKLIAVVLAVLLWYMVTEQIKRSERKWEMPDGWPIRTMPVTP